MRRITIFLSCMLLAIAAFADTSYSQWWARANKLYAAKQYDSAAHYYGQIAQSQPQNSEVYYNLGNTYYRLNNISMAVLNYEKALKVNPSHKEAADNLLITQSRIKNRIPAMQQIFFINWWDNITSGSKAGMWAVLSLLVFLGMIATAALSSLGKIRPLPFQFTLVAGVVLCVFLMLGFVAAGNKTSNNRAVVMQADIRMMSQPGSGKQLAVVPEGTTVELLKEQAGWVEVQLPDGRTGFVQNETLAKI